MMMIFLGLYSYDIQVKKVNENSNESIQIDTYIQPGSGVNTQQTIIDRCFMCDDGISDLGIEPHLLEITQSDPGI